MDWLNKEKAVFLVGVVLVLYAAVTVWGLKATPVGEVELPPSVQPEGPRILHWDTESTLFREHFGELWQGGRDPFHEKERTKALSMTRVTLPSPAPIRVKHLVPVPTFIGTAPIEGDMPAPPKPKEEQE